MYKLPMIVLENEDGNVLVYSSIQALKKDLESPDIEENEYTIYDAEGRLFEYGITETITKGLVFDSATFDADISQIDEKPDHRGLLAKALVSYLAAAETPFNKDDNIERLIEIILEKDGYFM